MADAIFEPAPNPTYSPSGTWERSIAPKPVKLLVTAAAAARAEDHELAVQALLGQLEDAVQLAGFSVTDASLLAEVLHDEEPSNHLFLALTVAGFQRQSHRLDLWETLTDMVLENEDPWISERLTLVVHNADS